MTSETTLKCNNPSFVINTVPAHSITDGPIQCHDGRHESVDFSTDFLYTDLFSAYGFLQFYYPASCHI